MKLTLIQLINILAILFAIITLIIVGYKFGQKKEAETTI